MIANVFIKISYQKNYYILNISPTKFMDTINKLIIKAGVLVMKM